MRGNFYTSELPPEKAALVRRIDGAGCEEFRTDRLSSDGEDEPARTVVQLKAYKMSGSETWEVVKRAEYITGEDKTVDVTPVIGNLCFFDALYYLAKFQNAEELLGQVVQHDKKMDVPHYKDAGEAAGQVFDRDTGMPVPVAGGRILGKGRFAGDPDETSAISRNINLLENDPTARQEGYMPVILYSDSPSREYQDDNTSIEEKFSDKMALRDIYDDAMRKAGRLVSAFDNAVSYDFRYWYPTDYDVKKFNSFCKTMGAKRRTVKEYLDGDYYGAASVEIFNRAAEDFSGAVANLPPGHEKKICEEFARLVNYSFHAEHVRYLHRRIMDGDRSNKTQKQMFAEADRAAECLCPDDEHAARTNAEAIKRAIAESKIKKLFSQQVIEDVWCGGKFDYLARERLEVGPEASKFFKGHGMEEGLRDTLTKRIESIENAPL